MNTIPLMEGKKYAPWVYEYGLRHPYGYCQCGCGNKAPLSKQGDSKWGYMRGEPSRFIMNHHNTDSSLANAFWNNVKRGEPDECWEWQGSKTVYGYGRIKRHHRNYMAHKVAYELSYDTTVPDGMIICHKCDNRGCVNPNHLFPGSYADNSKDMTNKDRQAKGENHGKSKLTPELVREIRGLASNDWYQKEIAEKFGIHQTTVSAIVKRITWKHVE